MSKIRILLVDDHAVVRRSLCSYLNAFEDLHVVNDVASGEEALEKLDDFLLDVAVIDLLMPGGVDGLETARTIRIRSPHTQVVILTALTGEERLLAALRAGVLGYIRKESDPALLVQAIRAAVKGQSTLDPMMTGRVLQDMTANKSSALSQLTEREKEVLLSLAQGNTNRQIGEELVISEETVKTHVANVLMKLQLDHRSQAVIYALKNGLLTLDDL